jgi:uncharacterized protein with PIN domain
VSRRFDDFVKEANISVEPVTSDQAQITRAATAILGEAVDIRQS